MASASPVQVALVKRYGLTEQEYGAVCRALGRAPDLTELGVLSALWSEHCSYKHSSTLLKSLPTTGQCVLRGPGENAGAVDLGNGLACVFKMESHNHPTAVEPFQGAATGVGGIIRDILAMGARPIALLNSLRFGPPRDARAQAAIQQVIAGIGYYGNCVGIPTVGGEFNIDPCYTDNCLVNVMCLGLARHEDLLSSTVREPGHWLIYYGNATGRDGVHGATFASAALSEQSKERRACVQVADPFMGKKVLEATLELVADRCLAALQDMGAAGLTCSAAEPPSKGGVGVHVYLDHVPLRAADLTPYEILLSESQERMLAVIRPENLARVTAILARWDLRPHVVGQTTDTGRFIATKGQRTEADLPLSLLCGGVPEPAPIDGAATAEVNSGIKDWQSIDYDTMDWAALLDQTLSSLHFSSKRWIYEQFDYQIQTNTVVKPGCGATVIRIRELDRLLAATADGNNLWCALDPYEGARLAVAEAARNLIVCGARPLAVTNNLNFGDPRDPVVAAQFAAAVRGIGDACRALNTPVTGGNVSFYNASPRMTVFPTPVIGMIGLIDKPERLTPAVFQNEGDAIILVGPPATHAGGSRILRDLTGELVGPAIRIDMEVELAMHAVVRECILQGYVTAATDVSDGGLLVCLAEMALGGAENLGCAVAAAGGQSTAAGLLSEEPSRFLLTCRPPHVEAMLSCFRDAGMHAQDLGGVVRNDFLMHNVFHTSVSRMRAAWERGL